MFVLTIGLGLSYGPMSAMYAEMFPANVRYSGISIGYAFGAILGGAFAATIAEALLQGTGWTDRMQDHASYDGPVAAVVADELRARVDAVRAAGCSFDYREIDPDIFGGTLRLPAYREVERIAAVGLVAVKDETGA